MKKFNLLVGGGGNLSSLKKETCKDLKICYNGDMMHHENGNKKAFTLAEVLITLGIIGVVAALTMPALINDIQDKHFRVKFKKEYSVLSQALKLAFNSADDLPVLGQDNYSDMKYHICELTSQLKYIDAGINCNDFTPRSASYWHQHGKWYTADKQPAGLNTAYLRYNFKLADGAWILFSCYRDIYIDVNGASGPNTIGRDIYFVQLPIGQENLALGFFYSDIGACNNDDSTFKRITQDNYEEDCESGVGWGCSPKYILE